MNKTPKSPALHFLEASYTILASWQIGSLFGWTPGWVAALPAPLAIVATIAALIAEGCRIKRRQRRNSFNKRDR